MNDQNKNEQDKERNWVRDWDQEKSEKTSASLDEDAEPLNEKE